MGILASQLGNLSARIKTISLKGGGVIIGCGNDSNIIILETFNYDKGNKKGSNLPFLYRYIQNFSLGL